MRTLLALSPGRIEVRNAGALKAQLPALRAAHGLSPMLDEHAGLLGCRQFAFRAPLGPQSRRHGAWASIRRAWYNPLRQP